MTDCGPGCNCEVEAKPRDLNGTDNGADAFLWTLHRSLLPLGKVLTAHHGQNRSRASLRRLG